MVFANQSQETPLTTLWKHIQEICTTAPFYLPSQPLNHIQYNWIVSMCHEVAHMFKTKCRWLEDSGFQKDLDSKEPVST